jgi:hypothetical protein
MSLRKGRASARPLWLRDALLRRRFFFRLAFQECDLLDAGGIAWAPGGDVRIVLESVVNDAAFVGVHWLELQ